LSFFKCASRFLQIRKWANSFYKKQVVQFQQCNTRKNPLSFITLKIFYIFTSLILLIFTASQEKDICDLKKYSRSEPA